MRDTPRRVAVIIGVARAGSLAFLGGALNGAKAFEHWARAIGYETYLVTDEVNPVTMTVLRATLANALDTQRGRIYRLILYFAGHGLIREAEEGLWLLSDWDAELRAVAQEALKRRLFAFDIGQIAIFADACRDLPSNVATADLVADAVLGRGPNSVAEAPPVDKFIAAQDGRSTYMVPGETTDEDRCLFSGVLIEGLWGTHEGAFSKVAAGKITSGSLGAFLRREVPEVARRYKCVLHPAVYPVLPEGDDIYFDKASAPPPPVPRRWPPWPSGALQPLGVRLAHEEQVSSRRPTAPATPSDDEIAKSSPFARMRAHWWPAVGEIGPGIMLEDGVGVRAIWSSPGIVATPTADACRWNLFDEQGRWLWRPEPLLIEFEDGVFAATAILPLFVVAVVRDTVGIPALVYRGVYDSPEDLEGVEEAIMALEAGGLRARVATELDRALRLRQGKHKDPVLGVISAYLYDALGDVDSIRRMAGYYVQHGQPIPYDIALLALVAGEWRNNDELWVRIPPVVARNPLTDAEAQHGWTHSSMPECEGIVGGTWPWMRQGWALLEDPVDIETRLIRPGLADLVQHLAPSRFTTFDTAGGMRLAALFGLQRSSVT